MEDLRQPAHRRAVAVFARAPRPGNVKTRLARSVGEARASAVYAALLRGTLDTVRTVDAARYLYLPAGERLPPDEWSLDGLTLRTQAEGDLGARLHAVFEELLAAPHHEVLALGSDCPQLTKAHIDGVFSSLRDAEVVVGPASDGGYWTIAQRAHARPLFEHIPWSTPQVWPHTRARLLDGGWPFAVRETLDDLDDEADLERHLRRQRRGQVPPAFRLPGASRGR